MDQDSRRESAYKPDSVPQGIPGRWSSIWDRRYRRPRAAYPSLKRRGPRHRLLFGLAPGGVYQADPVARAAGGLLPHLFTLTQRGHDPEGRFPFLWHFPSGHPAWALPSSLPCGVRTFLGHGTAAPATTRPTPSRQLSTHDDGFTKERVPAAFPWEPYPSHLPGAFLAGSPPPNPGDLNRCFPFGGAARPGR